jgi:hypothetical protein
MTLRRRTILLFCLAVIYKAQVELISALYECISFADNFHFLVGISMGSVEFGNNYPAQI